MSSISNKKILVTGAAGFIGFHTVNRLCSEGYQIVGIDNLNDYYDVQLKIDRLKESGINADDIYIKQICPSQKFDHYNFSYIDITDKQSLLSLFENEQFDYVIHLAAQAGVRYSLTNPDAYISSNITGFLNILEACRAFPVKHMLYASSSSVYGNNLKTPFSETDLTDDSVSLYAATKKSNELMAHTYSHLFQIPTTGMRFFTVYGPWGRPDMAYFSFSTSILEDKPIQLFHNGQLYRDFTYIDDIIESIFRLIDKIPNGNTPKRILNLGNANPVLIKDFVSILEKELQKNAEIISMPMQDTDVFTTFADTHLLEDIIGFTPKWKIEEGLKIFSNWFLNYSNKKKSN